MTNDQVRDFDRLMREGRAILSDANMFLLEGHPLEADKRVKMIDLALAKVVRARTMLIKYA